jgi:hypothetical protein
MVHQMFLYCRIFARSLQTLQDIRKFFGGAKNPPPPQKSTASASNVTKKPGEEAKVDGHSRGWLSFSLTFTYSPRI